MATGPEGSAQNPEASKRSMAIILDTDVIIKGEKGRFDLIGWLAAQTGQELEIAAITVAELWHGIERATIPHRAARERHVRTIVDRLEVIPYTDATALVHAQIWASLESSGKMIGAHALILAATAFEHRSSVATFNKSFTRVPWLKVIKPA
jgi:tRNA(fMet)-specific endonuclease VapC